MAVLATDDFARPNDPDLGPDWDVFGANDNFKILSATATPNNVAGADAAELNNTVSFPADQYAEVTLTGLVGGASGTGLGVMLRATGPNTYYRCVVAGAGANNVVVSLRPAGTTIGQRTQTFSDGDVFRAEIQGSTIRVFYNGVQMGADMSEGTIATGNIGIFFSSTITSGAIDLFNAGSIDTTPVDTTTRRYQIRHSRMTSW